MPHNVIKFICKSRPQSFNGLRVFMNDLLVFWYKNIALLCHFACTKETVNCFGVLNLPGNIKDVITVKESTLCLLEDGRIYFIDLGDVCSRKSEIILKHKEFIHTKDVNHICATKEGFIALKQTGEILVFKLTTEPEMKICFQIRMVIHCDLSSMMGCNYSHLAVFKCSDFNANLASFLFRESAILDCYILFIGLENGNVYWVPLLSSSTNKDFTLLHCLAYPVKGIVCTKDENTNKYNKIILLSSNGSLALLGFDALETHLKYNTFYFSGSIKSFCLVKNNNILYSDGLNLWHSRLVDLGTDKLRYTTELLTVKGANALAAGINGHYVLAACKHAILYKISLTEDVEMSEEHRETFEIDSKSVLSKMHQAANELSSLTETTSAENKALHEISVACRGDIFKDNLKITIEMEYNFPSDDKEILRVKVTNKSNQEFSREFWSLKVLIKSDIHNINMMQRFESAFKPNSTLVSIIPINSSKFPLPVAIDCSLILTILSDRLGCNAKPQFLEIPLHKQFLDITHFLSPVLDDNLTSFHVSRIRREESWKNLLMRFKSPSSDHALKSSGSYHLHCYSFKLPVSKSWEVFIEEIIKNSKHRFHHDFKDTVTIKFRIKHSIVMLSHCKDNHKVDVVSSSKEILSDIKDFIIYNILQEKEKVGENIICVCLDETDLVKAQNVKLTFELGMANGVSMEKMNCLRREIREFANNRLPL